MKQKCRLAIGILTIASGMLAGCGTHKEAVSVKPVYTTVQPNLYIKYDKYTMQRPEMDRYSIPDPIYVPKQPTPVELQPLASQDTLASTNVEVKPYQPIYAGMAAASAGYATEATSAINENQFYAAIEMEFEDDTNDSEKMRAFKALKDSLDIALTASGMTPDEIKRFYILNYLSRGPAPERVSQQGQSDGQEGSSVVPITVALVFAYRRGLALHS